MTKEVEMIKVKQTVEIYEENDQEVSLGKEKSIGVESHWNHDEWVILIAGKRRITVNAEDLKTAIDNATNINRF
jgi:hypothetical protein